MFDIYLECQLALAEQGDPSYDLVKGLEFLMHNDLPTWFETLKKRNMNDVIEANIDVLKSAE